jgi:hypothetical protein
MRRAQALIFSAMVCSLFSSCETLEIGQPVTDQMPRVTIATANPAKVRASLVSGMTARGYRLDYDSGNIVILSRPLPALQVVLLTESLPGRDDREVQTCIFHAMGRSVQIEVSSKKRMKLPGGAFNDDPFIDRKEFNELQGFLDSLKSKMESA